MRRRSFATLLVVLGLLTVWAAPVGAIGGGEKSTDGRVGALFATLAGTIQDGPVIVCSGSQASDTVFLTAGHCLAWTAGLPPGTTVEWGVTFTDDAAFDPNTGLATVPLTAATGAAWDPGFGHDNANLRDYGVVLFEEGTFTGPFVDLPTEGLLDEMKADHELSGTVFDLVGYGTHPEHKQGPPRFSDDGFRYEAQAPFKALNPNWLRLQENLDVTDLGTACFGDSGSPILLDNVAVAVTTGGTPICRSDAFNQRLDTEEARAFLGQWLTLP
jgi:hypothetical protein